MNTRTAYRWALLLLVVGCSNTTDEEPPTVPPQFTVIPTAQWSGGVVMLRTGLMQGRIEPPTIRIAGIEAEASRVDDSTASVTLPVLPSQEAAVEVVDGSHTYAAGSVSIKGFRGRRSLSRLLSWESAVLESANGPLLINLDFVAQQAMTSTAIANLRSGQVEVRSGITPVGSDNLNGPGASYVPGTLILRDSTGKIGMWQVTPSIALIDTAPIPNLPYRNVSRLSDSVWLLHASSTTTVRNGSAPPIAVQASDPFGLEMSATADRAIIRAYYPGAGATVLRMSTGDTLYRVRLHLVSGAGFSPDGLALHVAGDDTLLTVAAGNGDALRRTTLPAGDVADGITLSPDGSRIFVAAHHGDVPTVLVYDAATLTLRGRMQTPDGLGCDCQNLDTRTLLTPVLDQLSETLYLQGTADVSFIWDFDLLP